MHPLPGWIAMYEAHCSALCAEGLHAFLVLSSVQQESGISINPAKLHGTYTYELGWVLVPDKDICIIDV